VIDLKVIKIECLKIRLSNVTNCTPLCRTLHCFGCGVANLCLRDVLAIGKENYTSELMSHNNYLSFFTLILYHIEAGLSILLGKIIFKKILQKTLDKLCRLWYNTKFGAQRPRAAQAKEKEGFLPSFLVTVLGL
jgi:hypothetical protein